MAPLANGTALEDMFLVKILGAAGANAELRLTRVAMKAMEVFMMDECVFCVNFGSSKLPFALKKVSLSLLHLFSSFHTTTHHHPRCLHRC
jgi:hypothetical protein